MEGALSLPGREFSLAWLAVGLAPSEDDGRVALYRRVLVDVWPHRGVVLAATDSFWLARAFVPFDPDAGGVVPEVDEIAPVSFVVADVEHRVRELMKYVERRTRKCDDPESGVDDVDLTVWRHRDEDPDMPTLDPTLSAPAVSFEIPYEERVTARESEVDYPAIAQVARFQPRTARQLVFNPQLMTKVASASARIGSSALRLTPTSSGSVSWVAEHEDRHLHGVLMPIRDPDDEFPGVEE